MLECVCKLFLVEKKMFPPFLFFNYTRFMIYRIMRNYSFYVILLIIRLKNVHTFVKIRIV